MAFELPSLPNFNTTVPQQIAAMQSPVDAYGKMLQLRSLLGQQSLQPLQLEAEQERVKQAQLQTTEMQQQQESQKAMIKAWSDPDFLKGFTGTDAADKSGVGFDPNAMTSSLINKGVLPKDATAMTQQFIDRSAKMADLVKAQAQGGEAMAAQRDKGYKILADQIGAITDAPSAKAADMLAALKKDLATNQAKYSGVPKEDLAHVYSADLEHLPAMASLIGLDAKLADYHKSVFESQKAGQGVIPTNPQGQPTALSPEAQQGLNKEIALATNPQVQQGKEQVAAAEGAARAAVETASARGGAAALAKVPKELIAPAVSAANKAGEDYAAAKSVSDRMQATMEAARKGNVISYQIIPEEGTLQITTSQGVHRINKTEIDQYAGGGSLWQRMEGHFGKALTGQSIPSSVLDDMQEIQKIQQQGAQSKYENSLKTINQNYGSEFKPVEMQGLTKPKSAQGGAFDWNNMPAHTP
jgi:hypothetical protein